MAAATQIGASFFGMGKGRLDQEALSSVQKANNDRRNAELTMVQEQVAEETLVATKASILMNGRNAIQKIDGERAGKEVSSKVSVANTIQY